MVTVRGRRNLAKAIGCNISAISRFNKKIPLPVEKQVLEEYIVVKYYDVEKCRQVMKENCKASVTPHYLRD